jgi:hypothetical protein
MTTFELETLVDDLTQFAFAARCLNEPWFRIGLRGVLIVGLAERGVVASARRDDDAKANAAAERDAEHQRFLAELETREIWPRKEPTGA